MKEIKPQPKRCPLNRLKPCIGEQCGWSINTGTADMQLWGCSMPFIGHELFILSDAMMQQAQPMDIK
jgi:hypothetical protein